MADDSTENVSDSEESSGDSKAMAEDLYEDLRHLAQYFFQGESAGHTLQPTALVHEAWLKLADQQNRWKSRSHFLAVAANLMRRILVDHARRCKAEKRGSGKVAIELKDDMALTPQRDTHVLAVDEALIKLAHLDPEQARIVELRFFGGLTMNEIAETLGMPKRTVERHWTFIRAWLRNELQGE